jgi:hypothetical protein
MVVETAEVFMVTAADKFEAKLFEVPAGDAVVCVVRLQLYERIQTSTKYLSAHLALPSLPCPLLYALT